MIASLALQLTLHIGHVGAPPTSAPSTEVPWPFRSESWRTDPAWYDGRAEKCVYEAERSIYGVTRRFEAIAYTNAQRMDRGTTTKAEGDGSQTFEVFKHHWSERVPTEAYDYDFSTVTFTRKDDLAAYKLTASTQEDCGASFKQAWRAGERFAWLESVYFPGRGLAQGELIATGVHFEDELPLLLRDFPYHAKAFERADLLLIPSQKSTRSVPFVARRFAIVRGARETLELPAGAVDAHALELRELGDDGEPASLRATLWFAAEGAAPWLHALVRYEGPGGLSYRLRSIERTAYWER